LLPVSGLKLFIIVLGFFPSEFSLRVEIILEEGNG
jgi:hypothetical protein